MDTGEDYIKMCEKAVEIYTGKIPDYSFYIKFGDFDDIKIKLPNENIGNGITWLPRQDQLQGMVTGNKVFPKLRKFNKFVDSGESFTMSEYLKDKVSMEQLWLAFVMKEKYQKTWNGKDWETKWKQ